eukprot:6214768-Pleurochrysis_carterae.AAC.6
MTSSSCQVHGAVALPARWTVLISNCASMLCTNTTPTAAKKSKRAFGKGVVLDEKYQPPRLVSRIDSL